MHMSLVLMTELDSQLFEDEVCNPTTKNLCFSHIALTAKVRTLPPEEMCNLLLAK